MKILPDEIMLTCAHCHHFVAATIEEIKEDNFFTCPNCFSITQMDLEKFLKGWANLAEKVRRSREK